MLELSVLTLKLQNRKWFSHGGLSLVIVTFDLENELKVKGQGQKNISTNSNISCPRYWPLNFLMIFSSPFGPFYVGVTFISLHYLIKVFPISDGKDITDILPIILFFFFFP